MERAPRRMFVAILKKTNGKNEEKASRSAYDYLYHPILKLYPLSCLWEIVARKPDLYCSVTHIRYAQTRIADTFVCYVNMFVF